MQGQQQVGIPGQQQPQQQTTLVVQQNSVVLKMNEVQQPLTSVGK